MRIIKQNNVYKIQEPYGWFGQKKWRTLQYETFDWEGSSNVSYEDYVFATVEEAKAFIDKWFKPQKEEIIVENY